LEIASKTKTIQSCFSDCLYEVPNFQRPYSWVDDQLEDYWNDVVLANGDFFFGTTVTWISEKRPLFHYTYSLIDGQQRLTTSAVALSVIRDLFQVVHDSLSDDSEDLKVILLEQKAATQKYLITKDDDFKEYAVIKRPEPQFWEDIQKPGSIPSGAAWSTSARLVGQARTYFERKITAEISQLTDPQSKLERLKTLRNNMLQARVIQVELSSEEDAFLIFETLNTRGADLKLADLVKNMLVRGLSEDPADRDAVATRWQSVVDDITSNGDNPDSMDRFIWQSWNSRRDAVKEPELYKKLKALVSTDGLTYKQYLDEIETDSRIFRHLEGVERNFPKRASGSRQALAIPEVQDSIRALEVFNVSVANSAVIALVRKYNETQLITEKQLKRAMAAIENFHFQFTAMANSGSTGGTRGRYNRFSVTLADAGTKQGVSLAIDDFVARLRSSLPPRVRVEGAFQKVGYAPQLTLTAAQRSRGAASLIRYILITMAKRLGNLPPAQDGSAWTIEHIVPQNTATKMFDDPVYSIGNLALLSAKTNSSSGDADFATKKAGLVSSGFPKDPVLTDWLERDATFTPSAGDLAKRSQELAKLALDSIWTVA